MSHAKNGVIFFDSCWKEGFNFYESYSSSKKFNSVSHVLKSSILWVVSKKVNIFFEWYFWEKVQFFEPNRKKGPILPFIRRFCCSNNLLGSNSLSPLVQSVQSIEWNIPEKVQFFGTYSKGGFNALSHIQLFESNWRIIRGSKSHLKSSILWVIFFKKFNSWRSYYEKKAQVFE